MSPTTTATTTQRSHILYQWPLFLNAPTQTKRDPDGEPVFLPCGGVLGKHVIGEGAGAAPIAIAERCKDPLGHVFPEAGAPYTNGHLAHATGLASAPCIWIPSIGLEVWAIGILDARLVPYGRLALLWIPNNVVGRVAFRFGMHLQVVVASEAASMDPSTARSRLR